MDPVVNRPVVMRYPLWAFLVLFLLPAATLHAVLAGKASFEPSAAPAETIQVAYHHF